MHKLKCVSTKMDISRPYLDIQYVYCVLIGYKVLFCQCLCLRCWSGVNVSRTWDSYCG